MRRNIQRTFDVPMKLALGVQVFKSFQKLADDDGNVFFSEDARFHLQHRVSERSLSL